MFCGGRFANWGWQFETVEWSLETEDGRKIELLDEGRVDPLEGTAIGGNT